MIDGAKITAGRMTCVAVVVTRNRFALLKRCIEALLSQTFRLKKIVVIDNASSDGTKQYLAEINDQRISVSFMSSNIGGAGGFNRGLAQAMETETDYFWLLDDDVIPRPDSLERLMEAASLVASASPIFICSKVVSSRGRCINVPSPLMSGKGLITGWPERIENGIIPLSSGTFASCLVSRRAVERVGLPIREYFIWGDDTEYTKRIIACGGAGYLAGKSVVLHMREDDGDTMGFLRDKARARLSYFYYRNGIWNMRKYGSCRTILRSIVQWGFDIVRKASFRSISLQALSRGLIHGLFCSSPKAERWVSARDIKLPVSQ
jgi:dTDP-4-dehydrorhamnose reductase